MTKSSWSELSSDVGMRSLSGDSPEPNTTEVNTVYVINSAILAQLWCGCVPDEDQSTL